MNNFKNIKSKDIIIIDCEASGLNKESYPIEVGVSFKEDSFGFLIKPHKTWNYWSMSAENIHNIKKEDLFKNGLSCYEAANFLNNQLRGLTLFSDAVDFENFWINKLFEITQCEKLFDIESIYELSFDYNYYKKIKEKMSNTMITHRAENDANIIRTAIEKSLYVN